MDAAAEWGEDADPPVAQLVSAALDDYIPIVGDLPGGFLLVGQEAHQVLGGSGVEIVIADEAGERCRKR